MVLGSPQPCCGVRFVSPTNIPLSCLLLCNDRRLAILHPLHQAGRLLHEQKTADLLADLEETKSAYRAKREAARDIEGAAKKAKRELSGSRAVR